MRKNVKALCPVPDTAIKSAPSQTIRHLFGDATGWGTMTMEYTFHIVTDGQSSTSELYAADDDAARTQALLATSEAFKDHAQRGDPFATITVKVTNPEGEAIFHARIEVSKNPFATDPGTDVWLDA